MGVCQSNNKKKKKELKYLDLLREEKLKNLELLDEQYKNKKRIMELEEELAKSKYQSQSYEKEEEKIEKEKNEEIKEIKQKLKDDETVQPLITVSTNGTYTDYSINQLVKCQQKNSSVGIEVKKKYNIELKKVEFFKNDKMIKSQVIERKEISQYKVDNINEGDIVNIESDFIQNNKIKDNKVSVELDLNLPEVNLNNVKKINDKPKGKIILPKSKINNVTMKNQNVKINEKNEIPLDFDKIDNNIQKLEFIDEEIIKKGESYYQYNPNNNKSIYTHTLVKDENQNYKNKIISNLFIFILDQSGSMDDYNKNDLLIESMLKILDYIPSKSYVQIIKFGSDYKVFNEEPLILNDNNKNIFINFIKSLYAEMGETNINSSLEYIFEENIYNKYDMIKNVLILTDGIIGDINLSLKTLKNKNNNRFIINSFGYGYDVDENNIKSIASYGNGKYYFIKDINTISEYFEECIYTNISPFSVIVDFKIKDIKRKDYIVKVNSLKVNDNSSINISIEFKGKKEYSQLDCELTLKNAFKNEVKEIKIVPKKRRDGNDLEKVIIDYVELNQNDISNLIKQLNILKID